MVLEGLPSQLHIIFAGFHVLTVLYFFDFLQLSTHREEYGSGQRVTPFHVFVVAWLLPFVMTFMPSLEHLITDIYFEALLGVQSEMIERTRMQIIVRSALFSSLVVLVPLEFFQHLFINKRKAFYRHALITAGCLDVAALFFLLQLATEETMVKISTPRDKRVLIFYLLSMWILSLLASFRAIYISQYSDPKKPEGNKRQGETSEGSSRSSDANSSG